MGEGDIFFHLYLHCVVDDEVCSIWGSNGIIEGEHVTGKFLAEGVGHMSGDEAADGCGDSEWSKF